MATQIEEDIPELPIPPYKNVDSGATFVTKAEAFRQALKDVFQPAMNYVINKINIISNEVSANSIIAENSAIIASGLAQFKGVWSGIVIYGKGESVESTMGSKIYYTSKVDNNLNHSVADTNYWLYNPINDKLDKDFSLLTDKTTPIDTDILAIRETGGLLKKISWVNIKATLLNLFVAKDANGNVGINNNAPLQKLHVGGSIIAGDAIYASGLAFVGVMLNNNNATPSLDIRRWNGIGTNHGVIKIAGNAEGAMLFFVDTKSTNVEATTERMRIDSIGNLLIGTSVANGLDKVQIEGTFSSKAVKAFTGIDLNTLKTRTEVCSVTNSCTNLPIAETGILEIFMFDSNSQWVMQRFTAIGFPNVSNQGRTYVRNWMSNNTWSAWVEK